MKAIVCDRYGSPDVLELKEVDKPVVKDNEVLVRVHASSVNAADKEDIAFLIELIEAGKVTPVIDRTYPLSETPEAFRYLDEGHAQGKVVITVEHNNK